MKTRLAQTAAHPERFVTGPPQPADLPTAVWVNPPRGSIPVRAYREESSTSHRRGPCRATAS